MPQFQPAAESWTPEQARALLGAVEAAGPHRTALMHRWVVRTLGLSGDKAHAVESMTGEGVRLAIRALDQNPVPADLVADGVPPWFGWELPRKLAGADMTRERVWAIDGLAYCMASCLERHHGARWFMDTDPTSTAYRVPLIVATGGRLQVFSKAFRIHQFLVGPAPDRAMQEWDAFLTDFERTQSSTRDYLNGPAHHERPPASSLVELLWVDSPEVGSGWELWISEDADPPIPLDALYSPLESFLAHLPEVSTAECTDRYQYQLELADESEEARSSIVAATERYLCDAMNK